MSNRLVTIYNCKVGDRIMYSDKWLEENPDYAGYMKRYNVVYLIIRAKDYDLLMVDLINHKGMIASEEFQHRITSYIFNFYE